MKQKYKDTKAMYKVTSNKIQYNSKLIIAELSRQDPAKSISHNEDDQNHTKYLGLAFAK